MEMALRQSWTVNGREMAEGSDGSGSEVGIAVDGGRDEVWNTVETNGSRRKTKNKCSQEKYQTQKTLKVSKGQR